MHCQCHFVKLMFKCRHRSCGYVTVKARQKRQSGLSYKSCSLLQDFICGNPGY